MELEIDGNDSLLDDDREEVAFLFDMEVDSDEDSFDLSARIFLGINPNDPFHQDDDSCPRRTPRGKEAQRNPKNSCFGKIILEQGERHKQSGGSVWDETHKDAKVFRQQHRIPYVMFDKICQEYDNEFDTRSDVDAYGRPKSDTRMLVMGVLRYLGQDMPFDALEELSDISKQKHYQFNQEFIDWFSNPEVCQFAKDYLQLLPKTDEEVSNATFLYGAKTGVPGTVGSLGCVHLAWDRCPIDIREDYCNGINGYPTVVVQVICSPTQEILGVSGPYYGRWNDKTICRLDENLRAFLPGVGGGGGDHLLATKKWHWVENCSSSNSSGNVTNKEQQHEEEGLHLICNGGESNHYPSWKMLMGPLPLSLSNANEQADDGGAAHTAWSKDVQSLANDHVECVFEMLTKRFMVLKYASRLKKMESIGKVFRTCCILHNMLHEFNDDDDDDDLDIDVENWKEDRFANTNQSYMRDHMKTDTTLVDGNIEDFETNNDEFSKNFTQADFEHRRDALIKHYISWKKQQR